MFNAQNFTERMRRQEVFTVITKTWPADQSTGLPPNTFTVMTEYFEYVGGRPRFVAETHHYRRGTTWRTEPDPKKLVVGDVLYVLVPE
jgi:hypothetical protein